MAVETEPKANEAQIAVHWKEEAYVLPSAELYRTGEFGGPLGRRSVLGKEFPECFREYADLLTWDHYWHTTLDTSDPPFWKWFVGGKLNACYNCVDRHLDKQQEQGRLHLRARARRTSRSTR